MEARGEDAAPMELPSLSLRLRKMDETSRRDYEQEEREYEEQRLAQEITRSSKKCSYDDEPIHYTEEVVHFSVSHAYHNGSEVIINFLPDEEGDYVYPPHFFEFSCWEGMVKELNEMVVDSPPMRHQDSLLNCDYCGSGICEWEIFGTGYLGELHVSPRMPNGVPTEEFVTSSKDPFAVCLGCLLLINDHVIELWEPEDLNQVGECQECTHARCWRWGQCRCLCHQETTT
jgi:hypothetical protein